MSLYKSSLVIIRQGEDLHGNTSNHISLQTWYVLGKKSIFRGNLYVEQSEEGIVEIIQNLIDFALEGHLTEELLRQDVGIIVGFVLNYPEVFSRFFLGETDAS